MTTRNSRSKDTHKRQHSFEWFADKLATSLCNGSDEAKVKHIFSKIEEQGISVNDPRLKKAVQMMQNVDNISKSELIQKVIPQNLEMFTRLFAQKLTISNFFNFKEQIQSIYDETKKNGAGKVADYIPQLAKADASQFAVSICTIDGQQLHLGESENDFTIQSCCKFVNYCVALEAHGAEIAHRYVGKEPSGKEFNAITLDRNALPHNPLTNAGAIMTCALIGRNPDDINMYDVDDTKQHENQPKSSSSMFMNNVLYLHQSTTIPSMQQATFEADRFELLNMMWKQLFAGAKIGFNNSVYLSEKSTGHRNYALGHFMYEQSPGFPPNTDLKSLMEFYFQCCSLEANTKKLSIAAATLANGGINPLTGKQVFSPETVRSCLSIMFLCGMYDYSGEFAFKIGIPSKSGVSGGIVSIVPNVMGICTFSPKLDKYGNSVRGIEFLSKLSQQFAFHHFDNLQLKLNTSLDTSYRSSLHFTTKINTSLDDKYLSEQNGKYSSQLNATDGVEISKFQILSYCASGDLNALKRMYFSGCDFVEISDYDYRTPLHLASSCGHLEIVKFLIEINENVDINTIKDRWGGTPIDDAVREKHQHIIQYFQSLK